MTLQIPPRTCYEILRARDARFDGLFFTGVSTTGIYCRPVCRAKLPGRDRCTFYRTAAEAERAGFRACFRCRPELAPGAGQDDAIPRLVRDAERHIERGFLNDRSVDALAKRLGVTSRHLRRSMEATLGVTPVELAQTKRLALAKQLLHDTPLSLADVAFASGFGSVRRFNELFLSRFKRAPLSIRREIAGGKPRSEDAGITLRLDFREPYDFDALLAFLSARAIPGVEQVADGEYRRTVRIGKHAGFVAVRRDPERRALVATASYSLAGVLMTVAARLRIQFDLDAPPPELLRVHFEDEPVLAKSIARRPGLRVPGAFDGFETAVRAILGQQVSVAGATTLSGRFAERFGTPLRGGAEGLVRTFPDAARIAKTSAKEIAAIGLPLKRAESIRATAHAVESGAIRLEPGTDPQAAIDGLVALPGIGPWTAQYLAMRALRWPDAFPAGDLGLAKAMRVKAARDMERRAEPWRPWRAYAAMHLWSSLSKGNTT